MSTYATLLDYLGDQRPPEHLAVPPGGSLDAADPFLCAIAQELRTLPWLDAKIDHLRNEAAHLVDVILPAPYAGMEGEIMQRLAQWVDELRLAGVPIDRRQPCTAR